MPIPSNLNEMSVAQLIVKLTRIRTGSEAIPPNDQRLRTQQGRWWRLKRRAEQNRS